MGVRVCVSCACVCVCDGYIGGEGNKGSFTLQTCEQQQRLTYNSGVPALQSVLGEERGMKRGFTGLPEVKGGLNTPLQSAQRMRNMRGRG